MVPRADRAKLRPRLVEVVLRPGGGPRLAVVEQRVVHAAGVGAPHAEGHPLRDLPREVERAPPDISEGQVRADGHVAAGHVVTHAGDGDVLAVGHRRAHGLRVAQMAVRADGASHRVVVVEALAKLRQRALVVLPHHRDGSRAEVGAARVGGILRREIGRAIGHALRVPLARQGRGPRGGTRVPAPDQGKLPGSPLRALAHERDQGALVPVARVLDGAVVGHGPARPLLPPERGSSSGGVK